MAQIDHVADLRQHYRPASARTANKSQPRLDKHTKRFISLSRYFVISSTDEHGFVDMSPRGGEPGFVKILDDHTLLFVDTRGNNRLDTFENIIKRPKVGLMFLVQGFDETLRLKGTLSVHEDSNLLARVDQTNIASPLVARFDISELFFHCGKATMRSKLWDADAQVSRCEFPSIAQVMKEQQNLEGEALSQDEMVAYYKQTL